MAVRNGEYTMLYYDKQIKGKRKLLPVYTLSLYYGEGEWKYPTRISDMVDVSDDMKGLFQDWDAGVIDVKKINPALFKNDELRMFIGALQRLYGWNKKLESLEGMILTRRVALLVGVVSGTKDLVEKVLSYQGGKIDMCKAVDEYGNEREALRQTKALISSIKSIMKKLNVNVEDAMSLLDISEEDRVFYSSVSL